MKCLAVIQYIYFYYTFTTSRFRLLNDKNRLWSLLLHVATFKKIFSVFLFILHLDRYNNVAVSNQCIYMHRKLIIKIGILKGVLRNNVIHKMKQ